MPVLEHRWRGQRPGERSPRASASLGQTSIVCPSRAGTPWKCHGMRCACGRRSSPLRLRARRDNRNRCGSEATEQPASGCPKCEIARRRSTPGGVSPRAARSVSAGGCPRRICIVASVILGLAKGAKMWRGSRTARRTARGMSRGCAGGPQGCGAMGLVRAREHTVSRSVGPFTLGLTEGTDLGE